TLVQEGQFTQPSPGLTVYARQVLSHGTLKSLFVDQQKPGGGSSTFTAKEGQIAERNGLPVLIMRHGSNQQMSRTGVLDYLAFDEYTFDLSPFMPQGEGVHYKASDRYLHELFYPDLTQTWEQQNELKLYAEGHARLAGPLYNIALVALALSAVLGGGFSRMGYGKRIAMAAALAAVVRILGVGVQAVADDNAWLNLLQYAVPLAAIAWAMSRVFRQKASRFVLLSAPPPLAPVPRPA
ncbi:MAG: lptF, partial [Caulobacteraceae bacterium]|nr:lptF [Caulobacteraceae bacterium]